MDGWMNSLTAFVK